MNWLRSLGLGFSVSAALASAVACSGKSSLGTSDERQEGNDGGGSGGAQNSGGVHGETGGKSATGGKSSTGGMSNTGGSAHDSGGAHAETGGTTGASGGKTGSGGGGDTGGSPGSGGNSSPEDCADRACAPLPPTCPVDQAPGSTEDNCCVRCLPQGEPSEQKCPESQVLVHACAECGLAGGCMGTLFACRPRQDCASGAEPCAQGAHCSQGACVDFGVFGCI